MTAPRTLVGVVGSGMIGYDPFARSTWSGISYFLFTELQRRQALHRAFGVEVSRAAKAWLRLRHFHPRRRVWVKNYYMSRGYLNGLTAAVGKRLRPDDFAHDFLQLGAVYDVPRLVGGRARCFSYHDGNLAQSLRSPYSPKGLSARRVAEGLAFERAVYAGLDRVFAMSEYLRQSFIDDYGVPAERVSNIGAGVNLDALPEPTLDKRYDTHEVLFIGVDFPRKGGPLLLEAFQRVRETLPNARLHVVGPRQLVIPSGLDGGVEYHGYLTKTVPADAARLDDLFRRASLFVLPSLYEPFGIAPLEAMAHRVPALVSRGWALQETVTPGVTGDHVTPGSRDDLVDKLRALLTDPAGLERMGRAGRDEVVQRHTWPKVIDRMLDQIRAVQAAPSPHGRSA